MSSAVAGLASMAPLTAADLRAMATVLLGCAMLAGVLLLLAWGESLRRSAVAPRRYPVQTARAALRRARRVP